MPANRVYKDSVFSLYLSQPERLVEVYNAVAGTNYPSDTPVQINTLEDVLWKEQINDLSFVLDGQMVVLIEHQSTSTRTWPCGCYCMELECMKKCCRPMQCIGASG